MIKFIIISIIIILILFIIYYTYYIKESFSNINSTDINIEKSTNDNNNESIINHNESDINKSKANIENFEQINNLIKNGNFENGHNPLNHINQSGYNKIITKKNPGKSSYVLQQKKSDVLTYYQLQCHCDKNTKYNLYFWLSTNKPNIDTLDFEKLIHVKVQNENFRNDIPRLNYNIIQKVILSNNEDDTWYLIKYDFVTEPIASNKMDIYLNYSENLQFDIYYFTDLALHKVLIDAENFIYNDKLICYTDGYNYQANIPTWHDLSGNGNDLFWSAIPTSDLTIGSLSLLNQKIVGFPTNLISNEQFSILLCLNKVIENDASDNAVNENNSVSDFYILNLPGNDRYALEIKLKDNYLHINDKVVSKELILYNKSLLGIIYDNGIIHIYLDSVNVLSYKIGKLYFTKDSFIINKNKNLNYNIYSVLFYNRIINRKELNEIREYFIQNKDKNFSTPDINQYQMYNSAQFTVNNSNQDTLKILNGYNKRDLNNDSVDKYFYDTFDNKNNTNDKSIMSSTVMNNSTISNNSVVTNNNDKMGDCIFSCINSCVEQNQDCLTKCKTSCSQENISANPQTQFLDNNEKIYLNTSFITTKCPVVYKKDGKYMVYVQPNSKYSEKHNFSGDRSYGTDRHKARVIYNMNFPDCPIPSELQPGGGHKFSETCPYVINELNPCYTSSCADVDWDVSNYKDLNINDNCKKAVSNYCHINYAIDDKCICWNPKYKNTPKCVEKRRFFEDPNDYCEPHSFKIEEHPDFKQYIKKDNIPCWGCKI